MAEPGQDAPEGLEIHREVLEGQGVPAPDSRADAVLRAGQPFVADLWEKPLGDAVIRSVYGWISLPGEPLEAGPEIWLTPSLVARALPGVTRVHLVDRVEDCGVLSMHVERPALRRMRTFRLRLQRCVVRGGNGLRWVASSEEIAMEERDQLVDLPTAFVEAFEIISDPEYGWLLGLRRVELGRRLGPVFAGVYREELRAQLARVLRHAAPVMSGQGADGDLESTSRIE